MKNLNNMKYSWGKILGFFFFFLAFLFVLRSCNTYEANSISYDDFRNQLSRDNIYKITVSGDKISGQFKEPIVRSALSGPSEKENMGFYAVGRQGEQNGKQPVVMHDFITYLPSFGDPNLFSLLSEKKVEIITRPRNVGGFSGWTSYIWIFLLVGIGLMALQGRRMQRSDVFSSVDQNRAKRYDSTGKRTYFSDVAGAHAAKMELQEIVEFLKNPQRFLHLGAKMPKGALLVGPPGTGKTMLARAVAGEAGVPFFSISGSDFTEVFVGVGASRVRSMFKGAKKAGPSIIFIDEIDSIGRRRSMGYGGGQDEKEQTLNQLLSEMDGFEANESIIIMAATNRPDILDPALLRPGRFDRHINVDLPSMEDRLEILKIHANNKPIDDTIVFSNIARSTAGFSGADLENLLNEAAILAARRQKSAISEEEIQGAWDRIIMGLERKNLIITDKERKIIAYHEGGHAAVAALLPNADPIYKVTIIARGPAMGVTQQLPEQEKFIYPEEYILDRLAVMLGGRAAEALVFDTATSGAEQDLKQATELARKMVMDWGMSKRLPHVAFGGKQDSYLDGFQRNYSEETARIIDQETQSILDQAYNCASKVLQSNRTGLDRLAELLIEKEEVQGKEVIELLNPRPRLVG
jgi:cell division protease FtsH